MPITQKLGCVVDSVVPHGAGVYTVALKPERQAPRFRAGQFLHLALDPYDHTGFWPDSRAFSIASSPVDRECIRITYAVHGRFTTRMERDLVEGKRVWVKMPFGDFVIDSAAEIVLFAGGTGITAFTAFLDALPDKTTMSVVLAYGARTHELLIYRELVERCAVRVPSLDANYFVEAGGSAAKGDTVGQLSVDEIWQRVRCPLEAAYYLSGPPQMLRTIAHDLRERGLATEAIHIDAWE
jgi:ferredoxin-NADP reductase